MTFFASIPSYYKTPTNPFAMYTSNLATAAALVGLAAAAGVPRAADAYPAIKRTPNWCGQINRHSDIVEVEATWKVPTVSLPAGASTNQNYYSLTWIGTGGDAPCGDTGDLFQAGTSGTVSPRLKIHYYLKQHTLTISTNRSRTALPRTPCTTKCGHQPRLRSLTILPVSFAPFSCPDTCLPC